MFGNKKTKIDKLAKKKKVYTLKKERLKHKMHERNSVRENKQQILENEGLKDKMITDRKCVELDRKIEKIMRDIKSEQIYENQVADSEQKQYEKEIEEEKENNTLRGI